MNKSKAMKTRLYTILILVGIITACEDDPKPVDPIHEFIAFKGSPTISLNEFSNSETAYPLVVELKAFTPYSEDIRVSYEIEASNAEVNEDFTVTPAGSVMIRAGKLVSDTIYIKTIDNETGTALERSVGIRITDVDKENIKIGLGITEPKNAAVTMNILDDECSETTGIFNASLLNTLDWGGGDVEKPATGVLTGDKVKVTGDLIDYGAFPNASITITLTPQSEGSTKGTATFGEQVAGTDNDGYEYKFIQTGEGTYDVCSGVINVAYDIYYADGGTWVYWYSVTNAISAP